MAEIPNGMYAQVADGAILTNDDGTQLIGGLPASFDWPDGRSTSSFHESTDDVLAEAGYLPVVADEPAHNPETERLSAPSYTVRESDVLATYTVEAIPPEGP